MPMDMLDKTEHARIIEDFERVCTVAGIQARFMHHSMKDYCSPAEVGWVVNFWREKAAGLPGLVLDGVSRPDTRCQAIGAALVRNYIDARVMPLNTVLDLLEAGEMPAPTVLLIPNLLATSKSKNLPAWKVQVIYDLLLERAVHGRPTVVYVEDMLSVPSQYGAPFADFLTGFKVISE